MVNKWIAKKFSYKWAHWLRSRGQEVSIERRVTIEANILFCLDSDYTSNEKLSDMYIRICEVDQHR